jgi:hypothetical protein
MQRINVASDRIGNDFFGGVRGSTGKAYATSRLGAAVGGDELWVGFPESQTMGKRARRGYRAKARWIAQSRGLAGEYWGKVRTRRWYKLSTVSRGALGRGTMGS